MIDNNLKIFFKKIKKSQRDIAKETGVHLKSISNYCTGKQTPGSDFLQKLHLLYNLNVNWLVSGKGKILINDNEIMGLYVSDNSITYIDLTDDEKQLALEIIQVIRRRNSFKKVIQSIIEVGKTERKLDAN